MNLIVMIPTFNERNAIGSVIQELLTLPQVHVEVLVVDDNSPDGTGQHVAEWAARHPVVTLVQRSGTRGRGTAGREGFLQSLRREFDYLVEMDGDGSHQPKQIPALISAMQTCDVAVGSRLIPGGSDFERPWYRRWLTRASTFWIRRLLGLPVQDVNSGFRCYSRRALEEINPERLRSTGPSIVHEVLARAVRAGLRLKEVPIDFVERKKGASKLNVRILLRGYYFVYQLRQRLDAE